MARIYQRRKAPGGSWYVKYVDETGHQLQKALGPDKALAQADADKLVGQVADRKLGLVDARTRRFVEAAGIPLDQHIQDFHIRLQGRHNTEGYVKRTVNAVRHAMDHCGCSTLQDITPEAVDDYRAMLSGPPHNLSINTLNQRIGAVKRFTRYMMISGKTPGDILVGVSLANPNKDRRLVRAPFNDDELVALFKAAEQDTIKVSRSFTRHGKPGHETLTVTIQRRDLLYRLAADTGLRLSEIRSLTPSSFNWDPDQPTVTVQALHSKHRKTDVQPLRRDTASLIMQFVETFAPNERIWGSLPGSMAHIVAADCRTAGIPHITPTGARRDFHALRVSFISRLARNGVPFRTVQELARHADPALTARVYAIVGLRDAGSALDSLPPLRSTHEQMTNTG